MRALGRAFGEATGPGQIFGLDGPLGAGKTQWVKGLGAGLGATSVINSPSFTIVKPHVGKSLTLHHADLYRLSSAEECEALDLDALVTAESILAVEWAMRFPALAARALRLTIEFGTGEAERVVTATPKSDEHQRLMDSLRLGETDALEPIE
jgi:tRNA threonylcarbamoyladenosine biosynthesis protein TsaE